MHQSQAGKQTQKSLPVLWLKTATFEAILSTCLSYSMLYSRFLLTHSRPFMCLIYCSNTEVQLNSNRLDCLWLRGNQKGQKYWSTRNYLSLLAGVSKGESTRDHGTPRSSHQGGSCVSAERLQNDGCLSSFCSDAFPGRGCTWHCPDCRMAPIWRYIKELLLGWTILSEIPAQSPAQKQRIVSRSQKVQN